MSSPGGAQPTGKKLAILSFSALGVVYGDIGTSPLYAIREAFHSELGVMPTPENVFGILSLVFWSLTFVISFKYLGQMLRADNRGEGGVLALMALLSGSDAAAGSRRWLLLVGLFGTALLYGDGIITPVISVLGAMEGLGVAKPALQPYVVPLSAAILIALFLLQRRGTSGVGALFGPITSIWFVSIAILGVRGISQSPEILGAIWPGHAVEYFVRNGFQGFLVLAAVVLVVTGGEALYADMGHFGKRPIRVGWFAVVLPALLLNYFGQGALLLRDPGAADGVFFLLAPEWARLPLVFIATSAAITASQALISGAFSLTRQAIQLGYSPRMAIIHTSRSQAGQIYMPAVNWALMVACVGLTVTFQTSSRVAAAYGIAVTLTMTATSILFIAVARSKFGWAPWKIATLGTAFLVVDLAFFAANIEKIPHGGWFPLLVAIMVFALMTTWKLGRRILTAKLQESSLPLELFVADVAKRKPARVPGAAIFMTSDPSGAPPVLLHHLKHNKMLHERVTIMSIITKEEPQVAEEARLEVKELGEGFWSVIAYYGFMETPDVPSILERMKAFGRTQTMTDTSFYLGRETLIATRGKAASTAVEGAAADLSRRMPYWRKKLFVLMTNNARSAATFFGLPPNRVVELGAQIQF